MKAIFVIDNQEYTADLNAGKSIAIPLIPNGENPNCFYAPNPSSSPVQSGDWIGSIKQGGGLNFMNLQLNPHGNGTHTECFGHIVDTDLSIHDVLKKTHFTANVVSLFPELKENGDRVIDEQAWKLIEDEVLTEALIIRTLPNSAAKKTQLYSGNNPPYFSALFLTKVREKGYQHLLIDLPSVDREQDDGLLAGHKAFWNTLGEIKKYHTITEMIFVDENIKDGLYLLNIGISPLKLDASPSRPIIYQANLKI